MKSFFEQELFRRNQEEENFLYTQWRMSKTFVPKVQAVIAHIFPHFSLHDDSHSETILNRIESFIGVDELKKLSTTDIWLMLSAAYYHDLGMAVMAKDIEEIFADKKFKEDIKKIQKDTNHPLFPFADLYEVKSDGLYYKPEKLSGKTFDAAKFLLADFVRKNHHSRSKDSIDADELLHFKDTPIPGRIIDYLGRICECHGMKKDDVMALPKEEMGAYGDICHPRFIACMLRLGDLLDIDNNRFSDVLLSTLTHIPDDSLRHKEKHLSIKHFILDTKHLELMAISRDYDVYEITDQWFKMVKEELGWQRDCWSNIVPKCISTSLPVIDQLEIRLKDYDIIGDKGKSEFTIETPFAMELLQGSGIYKQRSSCMKELMQNSVDASYISIYLDSLVDGIALETPSDLYKVCDSRPINIVLKKEREEGDYVFWRITMEDKGVGMSKEDMKYLMQTGGKNPEKMEIVNKMPDFMKPSGSYGIGFQSVFMLTDEVELESWKQNSNSHITAILHNPAGSKKGKVILKSDDSNAGKHGTSLSFTYKVGKMPSDITYSDSAPISTMVAGVYDFVKDETLDYEIAKVVEEIQMFGAWCFCPVKLSIEGGGSSDLRLPDTKYEYFSKEQGLQLNIYDGVHYMSRLLFKNQPVKDQTRSLVDFFALEVNMLVGDAKEILTLNRMDVRPSYRNTLIKRVIDGVTEMVCQKKWNNNDKQIRALAAMFLQQYHSKEELTTLNINWLDKWMDYVPTNNNISYATILRKSNNATVRICIDKDARNVSYLGKNKNVVSILMGSHSSDDMPWYFLFNQLLETHPYAVYTSYKEGKNAKACYELSKDKRPLIENWKDWFLSFKTNFFSARRLMPCNEKYIVLKVVPDKFWSVDWTFPWKMDVPLMICPYIIKRDDQDVSFMRKTILAWDDCEEKLYQRVFDHRADEKVTLEDIRVAYKMFRIDTETYI